MKFKKLFKKASVLAGLGLIFASAIPTGVVQAKDSDHAGAAYLQVELDASGHRIQSNVSYAPIGNAWFGQDVRKSPEWMAEKISFSDASWKFTGSLLDSGNIQGALNQIKLGDLTTGKYFSPTNTVDKFKDLTEEYEKSDGAGGNLVLTFPGWAAGDRILQFDKNGYVGEGIDRNDDNTSNEFVRIDSKNAATAAGRVNDKLVSELNRALEDNYGQLITSKGKRNPDLSVEGFLNLLYVTVAGKFPDTGKTWTYNEVDYSIDTSNSVDSKVIKADNIWSKKSASDKLISIYPNRKGSVKSDAYTYAVPKGYQSGVGEGSDVSGGGKKGSDVYAITWADIAIAATSATAQSDKSEEKKDDNNTVVGEQVDNYLYTALSTLVGTLGVRNADELVFGEWGNLFKNNTYEIFLAVQAPFIVFAMIILSLSVINAIRKSSQQYLSINEVRSIQDTIGQCLNAIIMMLFLNTIVLGAIYLNNGIVQFAAQLSHFMKSNQVSNGADVGGGAPGGVFSFFVNMFSFATITSVLVSFVMVAINIKFTWRYVARAVSFGIYFVISPIVFALDALKGDGKLFSFGSGTGNLMKNIIALIFQQSFDAIGIALALNVGRIIFGNGMIVTILGFLSIEPIVNALMGFFGVRNGSIAGIAEAGLEFHQKAINGAKWATAAGLTAVGAKSAAAIKSGRNRDDERVLRGKHEKGSKDGAGTDLKSKIMTKDLNKEAQVDAYRKMKLGLPDKAQVAKDGTIIPATKGSDADALGWETVAGDKEKAKKLGIGGAFGAILEGATNKGVYGDKNSVSATAVRGAGMDSNLDLDNYKIDDNGRVRAANIKGRMQRLGRDVGRGVGGALGTFTDPKYAARTLLGVTAAGMSAMTPGHFDDAIATVANVQNLESAFTGGTTQSFAGRLASTWLGRTMGLKGANWDLDSVSAQSVYGEGTSDGFNVATSSGQGINGSDMFSSEVRDDTDSITFREGWSDTSENATKEQRSISNAAQELASMSNTPGQMNYSREELADFAGDDIRGQYATQLMDWMDKNGKENVYYDNGQVAFDQTMVRDPNTFVNEQDPKAVAAIKSIEGDGGVGAIGKDKTTGMVFKRSIESGRMAAFAPQTPVTGERNYEIKQRQADIQKIKKDNSYSDEQRKKLITDAYKAKDYQTFRKEYIEQRKSPTIQTAPPVTPQSGKFSKPDDLGL